MTTEGANTSNVEDNVDAGAAAVNAVKVLKLPQPFWKNAPARYFTVCEATFDLHGIKSDVTRYRHLLVHLDPDILDLVGDIIDNPPDKDKYAAIKSRLLAILSDSEETKIRKLLRGRPVGDEKPTVLLQKMRNLAGKTANEPLMKQLFMEQMPENVRSILAVNTAETKVENIALMAERIVDALRPQISAIEAGTTTPRQTPPCTRSITPESSSTGEIAELRATIATLTRKIGALGKREPRGRSRPRSRSRSEDRRHSVCYYHAKFGDNAIHCKPPCTFKRTAGN